MKPKTIGPKSKYQPRGEFYAPVSVLSKPALRPRKTILPRRTRNGMVYPKTLGS